MNALAALAEPDAPQRLLHTRTTTFAPLTYVSLAYVPKQLNIYLRFGDPLRTMPLDRWWRVAVFEPGRVFCRIWHESNDYGTTRWRLMVMQAGDGSDAMQQVIGVHPGVHLLLHVEGGDKVRSVLQQIDAIEVQGIAGADVSIGYWRSLNNRMAARLPLPAYTPDRHAAWLTGRGLQ